MCFANVHRLLDKVGRPVLQHRMFSEQSATCFLLQKGSNPCAYQHTIHRMKRMNGQRLPMNDGMMAMKLLKVLASLSCTYSGPEYFQKQNTIKKLQPSRRGLRQSAADGEPEEEQQPCGHE